MEEGSAGASTFADVLKANLLSSAVIKGVRTLASSFKSLASNVVSTGSEFDTAMSQLAATMGVTTDEVQELRDKAREMGAATSFSATEAAEGLNILAMAGLSATEQIEGINTVLDLAAAGAISMESAASYAVGAVKGFGDEISNVQYYADLMAKGATLANTSVQGLGEAMSTSAATAAAYGQTADGVTLALLRLADQNVTGTEAATALNRAMADLYAPTDAAKAALSALGVSTYDSAGNARDLNDVVDDLNDALSDMSAEEATAYKSTIFTTQGLSAFNKMAVSSEETIARFSEGLESALGSAAEQASTQLDNLQGDLTILDSVLSEVKISLYEGFSGGLREAAQAATTLVSGVDWAGLGTAIGNFVSLIVDNGPTIISVISGIGAGFVAWNVASLISGISGVIAGATTMAQVFPTVAKGVQAVNAAILANPLGAFITLVVAAGTALVTLYMTNEDFRNKVNAAWVAVKETVSGVVSSLVTFFTETIPNAGREMLNFFKSIPQMAAQWGKDLIQNFINGIKAKISALKDTVSNVAQTVKNFLGFSEPKEGPLSNFHTYAPDMMQLFANGIKENSGLLKSAFNSSLDFGTGSVMGFTYSGSGKSSLSARPTVSGGTESPITIIVQSVLDGKVIGETAYQYNKSRQRAYGVT